MSYYAFVKDGKVTEVIVAEQDFVDQLPDTGVGRWIQTSYNTRGNVHYGADRQPDGGVALRKNFASVGYIYNEELDMFHPPRPYDTWVLDTETGTWQAPVAYPTDGKLYQWDPAANQWIDWNFGQ
jgi:hypothetical protein